MTYEYDINGLIIVPILGILAPRVLSLQVYVHACNKGVDITVSPGLCSHMCVAILLSGSGSGIWKKSEPEGRPARPISKSGCTREGYFTQTRIVILFLFTSI